MSKKAEKILEQIKYLVYATLGKEYEVMLSSWSNGQRRRYQFRITRDNKEILTIPHYHIPLNDLKCLVSGMATMYNLIVLSKK